MSDQKTKDKLAYSTDKDVDDLSNIERNRRKIAEALDRHDAQAYKSILIELGRDPTSEAFRAEMSAFRRACNLEDD